MRDDPDGHSGQHPEFSAKHILPVVAMPTSRTIPDLLDELAARFPERDALVGPAPWRRAFRRIERPVRKPKGSESMPPKHPYLPRAQCDERIEYHPVDLQAHLECARARVKCPLGRNADVVDAGPPWRRLDALDQMRHLPLECIG